MTTYAVLDGGQVVSWREIPNWETYPAHKKAANDEKGDGGPVLRPRVIEGDGPSEQIIIELNRVRVVRSTPTPPPPPAPTKDQLIAVAASKRWTVQSGGITLNGAQIDTSTDSLALITGAIESLERGWTTAPIRFKAKNAWLDLSLVDLQGAAAAVSQHVQNCFSAEAAVVTKINNDTYTTVAAVNGASEWPA